MATQEQHMVELRSEIKSWEKAHFHEHGQKPTRKDIAANSNIAAKYKEYENLRATLTGRSPPHVSRKRKSEDHAPNTPSKRATKSFATPKKEKAREGTDEYVENTPQRSRPLMLGPTPQKNGIFVGMFDTVSVQTPSHTRSALVEVDDNCLHTPSKSASTPVSAGSRLQKTPMSEGKRFYLDQYMTPRKPKGHDNTPSSISKKFLTPAFFKQYTEIPHDVSGEDASGAKTQPWRRPKPMRTLSSMIKDLHKEEEIVEELDEAFDDEMMVLREMEEEEEYLGKPLQASKTDSEPPPVLQSAAMDRDGFIASDVREEHNTLPQDNAESAKQPSRAFKKKGQKRTTRRVKMRPIRTATKTVVEETLDDTDDEESEVNDDHRVGADAGLGSGEKTDHLPAKAKAKEVKGGIKEGSQAKSRRKKDHANYCKLKIKNKNSKANGRGFGRRR